MKLRSHKWGLVFRVNKLTAFSARADAFTQGDEET